MSKRLMTLRQKRAQVRDEARAITAAADKENRDLTAEEAAQVDSLIAKASDIQASIEQEERLADLDRQASPIHHVNQQTAAEEQESTGIIRGSAAIDGRSLDPKAGFANFGEFCQAVRVASVNGGARDPRLDIMGAAPTTYGNEGTGADGGFLVPTDFSNTIRDWSLGQDSFLAMADGNPVSGNSMVFPRDETTPWGSNGVRAYWEAEAATATQTKPNIGTDTLRLHKLFALVPVTDEILADAPMMSGYLTKKTGASILWKTNDALVNGSGAGMPLGYMNAGCLVSVAKETSQTADTINVQNIVKMFARMPASSMRNAVWLINNDAMPQIMLLTLGNKPIYMPPNGAADAPFGTLLGRPIILSQSAQTVGDKGDIAFVDWTQYNAITKAGGIDYATSIHLFFDSGATAFRATFRVDGMPWPKSSITPANGTNNLSPFVTLDERA